MPVRAAGPFSSRSSADQGRQRLHQPVVERQRLFERRTRAGLVALREREHPGLVLYQRRLGRRLEEALRDRGGAVEIPAREQAARQHELRARLPGCWAAACSASCVADGRAFRCIAIIASRTCAAAARGFSRSTSANDFAAASRSRFASWMVPSRYWASAFCGSTFTASCASTSASSMRPSASSSRPRTTRAGASAGCFAITSSTVRNASAVFPSAYWMSAIFALRQRPVARLRAQLLQNAHGVGRPFHPNVVVGERELRVSGAGYLHGPS